MPALGSVAFVRFNQMPEAKVATHEEKDRMAEEAKFGGRYGEKSDPASFGAGDSMFIIETVAHQLQRPVEAFASGCDCSVAIIGI